MITNKDLEITKLSPTKKDFYQIWNELLETAGKISERWDPSSTNESDPGIVLLKVLTGIADKLNYNIDKNILEAFMPSVTQQESMRKLCELVGYNIKYYQSAETTVRIGWTGQIEDSKFKVDENKAETIYIPMFTTVKDINNEICYTIIEENGGTISANIATTKLACIEGQVVQCGADTDYVISLNNIDDNNRYYLPEAQIAENGIFIYTIDNGAYLKNKWIKVDNLNTQATGKLVYKFGFDSKIGLPYIQFPDDISAIIEDGLYIWYTRTLGVNGNIKARTLTNIEFPTDANKSLDNAESFYQFVSVTNEDAAMNGCNIETINQAYNNYKRTIGTFDTLITCRDYINKIYELYDDMNIPLVSNIIASDVRDDLNRAVTLCTFSQFGISYVDTKLTTGTGDNRKDRITNFDIVLYPFKTVYGLNSKEEYKDSFKYSEENFSEIKRQLYPLKTISHEFLHAEDDDILCIKNYFKLDAKITTTYKVNNIEEKEILNNIFTNIYRTFNARQLEFGEDIPFDLIEECITNADTRIKNVSMSEPQLVTKICTKDDEYAVDSDNWEKYYRKLVARNILAGKVPLFKYNEDFKPEVTEAKYNNYDLVYSGINTIKPKCKITIDQGSQLVNLSANELIQFRAPSYKTIFTYPAYVNYFAKLNKSSGGEEIAATMIQLNKFMENQNHWSDFTGNISDDKKIALRDKKTLLNGVTVNNFKALKDAYGCIFIEGEDPDTLEIQPDYDATINEYYAIMLQPDTFIAWHNYICSLDTKYKGLFFRLTLDLSRPVGKLVDSNRWKYRQSTSPEAVTPENALTKYYVQDITETETYGIGRDSTSIGIPKNTERVLGDGEYILINYTTSSNDADGEDIVKNEVLKPGDIVRTNFDLVDSEKWAETHAYAKTNQSTFGPWDGYTKPIGMFSLGPNEQIEKRQQVSITLSNTMPKNMNFYWNLNSNDLSFPQGGYVLQEGEYFYYTDESKLEMIYFGNGTLVNVNFDLRKDPNKTSISAADILDKGITAIPWILATIDDTRTVTINEYQYITLGDGDTLTSLAIETDVSANQYDLSEKWWKVGNGGAEYIINGEPGSLPSLGNAKWEVHSKLLINSGPNLIQVLENSRDKIYYNDIENPIAPSNDSEPLSIKTNYLCQISTDEYSIPSEAQFTSIDMKVFKNNTLYIEQGSTKIPVVLNNFGKLWTKISYGDTKIQGNEDAQITLYTAILADNFGMLMIYYIKRDNQNLERNIKNSYITIESSSNEGLSIYNYKDQDAWWDNATEADKYYLRPGINCIKIPNTVTSLTIHKNTDSTTKEDVVIISPLDLVDKINAGVNTKLLGINDSTALLKYIRDIDTETNFYYNCQIENSNAIDINQKSETLATETIWYDYNNANNKFVISEIDADYLSTGITLTRASKL